MADKSNKLYDYDKILTNIAITNAQLTIKLDTINAEHQTNNTSRLARHHCCDFCNKIITGTWKILHLRFWFTNRWLLGQIYILELRRDLVPLSMVSPSNFKTKMVTSSCNDRLFRPGGRALRSATVTPTRFAVLDRTMSTRKSASSWGELNFAEKSATSCSFT